MEYPTKAPYQPAIVTWEELGPEGLRPARTLELKLPVYRPLLYTDTLHGDQINRDDMWAVSTDELNALRARLVLLVKVAEAAKLLMAHAMPIDCKCMGCAALRTALRELKEG